MPKTLEVSYPHIYRRFKIGQFVVQDTPMYFKAVGGDMKVEQSVQKISKGPVGHYVIGETRKPDAVAEFELLYHEIGAIASLLGFLTANSSDDHLECNIQPCFSKFKRVKFNVNVRRFLDFILARSKPYNVTLNVGLSKQE